MERGYYTNVDMITISIKIEITIVLPNFSYDDKKTIKKYVKLYKLKTNGTRS